MGNQTETTSQTTNSEPWKAAQPALETGLTDAQNLYKSGIGSQPYSGSTVIPYAGQTSRGMYGVEQFARKNEGTGPLGQQYQDIINSGGFNQPQKDALRPLQAVAGGDYLDRQDPNFERALSAASESAANQINMGAAGSGRYGSAIHQGNVAREIGNYEANQRVGQYNLERDRQSQAAQAMFNAGQQGFSNLDQAYQGAKAPWQDMMNIGSMNEDLASRMKNDEIRLYDQRQNSPWDQLSRLNAVASGAGSLGGTSTGTSQQPGQNPFATGLGYASSGVGILGGMKNLGWF